MIGNHEDEDDPVAARAASGDFGDSDSGHHVRAASNEIRHSAVVRSDRDWQETQRTAKKPLAFLPAHHPAEAIVQGAEFSPLLLAAPAHLR